MQVGLKERDYESVLCADVDVMDVYRFIANYIADNDISPAYREIMRAFRLPSLQCTRDLLDTLEEMGMITRLKTHQRKAIRQMPRNIRLVGVGPGEKLRRVQFYARALRYELHMIETRAPANQIAAARATRETAESQLRQGDL